jgi:muramoyltetrapeptide carboxypeptidase
MIKIPPYLKKGDTIGIVCPAGFMPAEKAAACINTLQQWGFKVKTGNTLGSQFHYFSGTDEARLADLQQMIDDDTVKAILCGRGGYGVTRIIDQLNFKRFAKKPKWIIGYSDITVLHAHLYSTLHIASLHSPMAGAFNDGGSNNEFVGSLRKALLGKPARYTCAAHANNRAGTATAQIVGGNLSLVTHLLGSARAFNTTGKILFLEDVGEYIYTIDRMMMQLLHAGKLDKLAGLIIGGFTEMKDTTIPFGDEVYNIIADKVKHFNYPVCYQFPVSHTPENYALKTGVVHQLIVGKKVTLKEIVIA